MDRFETVQAILTSLSEHGAKPALLAFRKEGAETYSFTDLADLTSRFARGLLDAGVTPGAKILLFAPSRVEWIIACLALIAAGMVPVPVDAQIAQEELRYILENCAAEWVFTTETLARRLNQAKKDLHYILLEASNTAERRYWRTYLAESGRAFPARSPEDLAVLFYTSGTSGRPKGVPLTHKNIASNLNSILNVNLINSEERILLPLPLHHVYPFTIGLLLPLAFGVPLILPAGLAGKEFLRALQEGNATAIIGVPRLYAALYEAIESSFRNRGSVAASVFQTVLKISIGLNRRLGFNAGRYLFAPVRKRIAPRLRLLASGGSALEPELAWKLKGLGWQIASGYGLTETSPLLTFNVPGNEKIGTAGRPIEGVELRISAPEEGRQFGEVLVRGPNVFSGYWKAPDKTEQAFTPEGCFRTGDLGCLDEDGFLHLEGRASSMIVLSEGENIDPEKVEAQLERSPYIREAGVLERKDRLVALLVPAPEARRQSQPLEDLIRSEVQRESRELPSHHRITDYALTDEPLPRTRIGKIRRHILVERFDSATSGKPTQGAGQLSIEEMSPEDQELLENPLAAAIWNWLPERFPDAYLTPATNLQLELGVNSLDWLNLTLEIRVLTQADLEEAAIRRIETVRDLLREAAAAARPSHLETPAGVLEELKEPEKILNEQQRRWLEPPPPLPRLLGAFLFAVNRMLMHRIFRLEVRGAEHLPRTGPFILLPNHTSYLDPLAVGAALSTDQLKRTYWAGWTGVMFTNRLMRLISRAARVMPIEQKEGPRSSVAFAIAALRHGHNLIWFPEGERSRDGKLQRFRPGIGLVATAEPVPLIPAWITGTFDALPIDRRTPRLVPITVAFGEPVDLKEIQPGPSDAANYQSIADALRDRVLELAKKVRAQSV
ncbi:MAG TPA: AMP-binding protein [Candidatus Binatia bacterium]